MAYARHKLRQCKQRKPNWKTKASQQHLSAQRFPPLSPSPSLGCYSCHLLYNSCQKPLDSAPRDTHTQRVATPVGQGVCAHPPPPSPSLAMVYPFPFARLLIPFVKCFLRYYYYVCLPICRLGLAHKLPARHRLAVHKSASEHN